MILSVKQPAMYALKLEIKLNNKERSKLAGCAGFARFVYNFGLSLLTGSWKLEDIQASDSKRLTAIEKVFTNHVKTNPEYSWMNQYPSAIYSQAFRHLGKALERWRKGESGFPRMKSKKRGDSFTVLKKSGVYLAKGEPMVPFTNRQVLYPGKRITIPGLGEFRLKQRMPFLCSSQTFTISRTANRWFVSFALDVEKIPPLYHEVQSVGIDLGVKCFATLSDGSQIIAPPTLKKAKIKLGKEQWQILRYAQDNKQLGNKKRGIRASSKAKKYYRYHLSRRHARIANIRKDFLQKTTTDISRKYYRIRIEDLNVQGMMANHKLAEAISSLGFYEFRRMLIYKEPFYGTKVELVDRWYPSSKMCSCCKSTQPMPLSARQYECSSCGITIERDFNASINLENAPNDRVRAANTELTPVDREWCRHPWEKQEANIKQAD